MAKAELGYAATFAADEFAQMKVGLIPVEMEDKWFIYFEGGWLHFHRSWTGVLVYALRFEEWSQGARVVESWVNRDPEQYGETNISYDRQVVAFLIESLLLGRPAAFPARGSYA